MNRHAVLSSAVALSFAALAFAQSDPAPFQAKIGGQVQNDFFGGSVIVRGNLMVVGAPEADAPAASSGRVSIYTRTNLNSAWTLLQTITPPTAVTNDRFGAAVALSDDLLVIGAPTKTVDVSPYPGAVQWSTASGGNGHWYYRTAVYQPYSASQQAATNAGAHLASITSAAENQWIVGCFGTNYFLGGVQIPGSAEPASGWSWLGGDPWGYTNWSGNEPNNWGGSENVLQMVTAGTWNDLSQYSCLKSLWEWDTSPTSPVGAAYLYKLVNGQFTFIQPLTSSNTASGEKFGSWAAISGSTIVVGAPEATVSGQAKAGAFYVFSASASGNFWTQSAGPVTSTDANADDRVGGPVAFDGTTIVAGAPGDDGSSPNSNRGAVYTFRKIGATWQQQQKIAPAGLSNGDEFGYNVSLRDGTLVVNAEFDDVGANVDAGSVYVFRANAQGQFTQTAQIFNPETSSGGDAFGDAVVLTTNRSLFIGSRRGPGPVDSNEGAVYVYDVDPTTGLAVQLKRVNALRPNGASTANDGSANAWFGIAVGADGNALAIGAPYATGSAAGSGAIYAHAVQYRDCNANGIDDAVDLANGSSADCNGNQIPDTCDVASGLSADVNGDQVPDTCQTLFVPSQYPTIQAALAAVGSNFRIIQVAPGTFAGPVELGDRKVILRGAGAGSTTISGNGNETKSVVSVFNNPHTYVAIEGFTIRDGETGQFLPGSSGLNVGGGFFSYNSQATLRDCVVEYCQASVGAGAYIYQLLPQFFDTSFKGCKVEGCTFRFNAAGEGGGGISLFRARGHIRNTVVYDCSAGTGTAGGIGSSGSVVTLEECQIRECNSFANGGGALASYQSSGKTLGELTLVNCDLTGNFADDVPGGVYSEGAASSLRFLNTGLCNNIGRNIQGPYTILGGVQLCDCVADFNFSGEVNGADLGILLGYWGPSCDAAGNCDVDLNFDGQINGADLGEFLARWGSCPDPI